ncbi:MAG: helix-turn-helix transcriptional regulator [Crocinitomicaceae bacterium]|nr:helix-turn-helix transcriptional regulator [Crocinitomicaceae bacterium]
MTPIRDTLEIFSGKWKIPIITALFFNGTCGFKDLERVVVGITPKMLSKELKDLEMNLLIDRTVEDTRSVTIRYSITEYGKTAKSVISELHSWGVKHRKKVFDIDDSTVMESCDTDEKDL